MQTHFHHLYYKINIPICTCKLQKHKLLRDLEWMFSFSIFIKKNFILHLLAVIYNLYACNDFVINDATDYGYY